MWKNYFKIAARNLLKRKLYAGINIFGLATGVACFILLALYLENEWTYDKWYKNATELYRLRMDYGEKGEQLVQTAMTPDALAPAAKDFPEVKYIARVYQRGATVKYGDKMAKEERFIYADASFFQLFSFPLKKGNAATVLSGPNMIVISETIARKYFGDANPIGKTLLINGKRAMQVTGVAADVPSNAHLKFDFAGSYSSFGGETSWGSANYFTYVQVTNNTVLGSLHTRLSQLARQQLNATQLKNGTVYDFIPEPVTGIHLHSIAEGGSEQGGDIRYNYIFLVIAVMLLVIACINFMNLATARSTERGREVGVRKALGAHRRQLFWQFIAESALLTGIALITGGLLAVLLLPAFNHLTDASLQIGGANGYRIYGMLAGIFFLATFLTGTYPAMFLSGFRPIQVLKGTMTTPKGGGLRKTLVVFQFAASIFFIICTLAVERQMQYIQHKKLGMDRSEVLVLDGFRFSTHQFDAFKNRLLQLSGISHVTAAGDSPVSVNGGYEINHIEGKTPEYVMNITAIPVEKDYVKTMGISLTSGEDVTEGDVQDVLKENNEQRVYHFYINETAAKRLGWEPESAVGKKMTLNGRVGTVKGVMKDFHFASMKSRIEPIIVFPEYDYLHQIQVKASGGNKQELIAGIEKIWKEYQPEVPFSYHFMDEDFNRLYKSEYRVAAVLSTFATVVMLVSCLGLLGLAALTTQQRTREIGIRKVLGASVGSVVALLSKDFMKLVLISLLVAAPLAWYTADRWLSAFAYHASLSVWLFLAAGALAITVALLTVSLQSVKAALMNPVNTLRSE